MADNEFLTAKEVSCALRVNLVTVHRWCKSGAIPATKIGGMWKIPAREMREKIHESALAAFDRSILTDSQENDMIDDDEV